MAENIKGITIEIGADLTGLNKAISGSVSESIKLGKELGKINSALKFDSKNIDLLNEKQKVLNSAITETKNRAQALQKAKDTADAEMAKGVDINRQEYTKLITELSRARTATDKYQTELDQTTKDIEENTKALKKADAGLSKYSDTTNKAGTETLALNGRIGDVVNAMGIKIPAGTSKAIAGITAQAVACGVLIAASVKLVSTLVDASVKTAALADDILVLAQTSGMSTDAIQEFNYAAGKLDVETETISGSLTKMIRSMNSARDGAGEAADAYRTLRVRVTDANGQLRDQNSVFYEVIDRLKNVKSETDRDALSMTIFGKSARDLNPLIEAGSDKLAELASQAHKTGYVMSGETLTSFAELQDSIDQFNNKSLQLKASLGEVLLPVLIGVIDALSKVDPEVMKVVFVIVTLSTVIVTVIMTIATVIKSIKSIASVLNLTTNPAMLRTVAIIMLVVAALIILGIVIATIMGRAKEMQQTFAEVGNSVGNITGGGNVRRYAVGTSYHPGGRALVGEQGPELVDLPVGSKVYNARKTGQILNSRSSSTTTNYYAVTVNGIEEYNEFMKMSKDTPAATRAQWRG